MTLENTKSGHGPFNAVVAFNRQIGSRFYRIGLEFTEAGAKAFADCKPGQFAQLDLSNAALPPMESIPENLQGSAQRKVLLRRPFSFCDVKTDAKKTTVEILYCVLGPATLRMKSLIRNETVSVIGPLGNSFTVPKNKKTALLVAGGMGAGPLIHLAKILNSNYPNIEATAFAGAKTAKDLPFEGRLDSLSSDLGFALGEFARFGVPSQIATEDGSAGLKGLVTVCLQQWLNQKKPNPADTIIFTCGPEAMLAEMAKIAQNQKIQCQISMERMMACGIGVCQSCAVECKVPNSNETIYKLCCEDGPVFDSTEVVFNL